MWQKPRTAGSRLHDRAAAVQADSGASTCAIGQLPGLSAQFARAVTASRVDSTSDPAAHTRLDARGAADFWRVTSSVIGARGRAPGLIDRESDDSVGLPSLTALPCDRAVRHRDQLAWSMVSVGYSAREIADVIEGHLTRADLDQAYARTMAGEPRAVVAAFLESRWREPAPDAAGDRTSQERSAGAARAWTNTRPAGLTSFLANEIAANASLNRVDPALVHAVIAAESGGNALALSPAGAIGLMQLMPATAAALGVNPWNPVENLRGGITYLASLLRAYAGDVRLALIAYNAGPQHADRVRDGRAVAYRETRQYLDAVGARYPLP